MNKFSSHLDTHWGECFSIKETGMKLTPEHWAKIRSKLFALEERAPSLSSIQLDFINHGDSIEGALTISGQGREFKSNNIGDNPLSIYLELEKIIDKKILKWKSNRFSQFYNQLPSKEINRQQQGGLQYEVSA